MKTKNVGIYLNESRSTRFYLYIALQKKKKTKHKYIPYMYIFLNIRKYFH